jgi:hypothetical protein
MASLQAGRPRLRKQKGRECGVVGAFDVRLRVGVLAMTVGGGGEVFDGAVETPYTITASALGRGTVVICPETEPSSSFSMHPG